MNWLLSALAGAATGVLSGFGIGGGTLLLLWLTEISGLEQFKAGGINLLYFISCAVPALIFHIKNGQIEKKAVIQSLIWGVPACILGALAAAFVDSALLRRIFGVFLVIVGVKELFSKSSEKTQREESKKE